MARHSEIGVSECNFPNHSLKVNSVDKSNSTKRTHNLIDLTGQIFGRWEVIEQVKSKKTTRGSRWLCKCQCGLIREGVTGKSLKEGSSRSCGCLKVSSASRHGMYRSPEYKSWAGMWDRCTNPNNPKFYLYRSRTPPEAWRDFTAFYTELGPKTTPKHSLDRIKNYLPYGPGNCRWATTTEQNRNKSNNIVVVMGGVEIGFVQACEVSGLDTKSVRGSWYQGGDMLVASEGLFEIKEST